MIVLGIVRSNKRVHNIMHLYLNMKKPSTRRVPLVLTVAQNRVPKTVCNGFVRNYKPFLVVSSLWMNYGFTTTSIVPKNKPKNRFIETISSKKWWQFLRLLRNNLFPLFRMDGNYDGCTICIVFALIERRTSTVDQQKKSFSITTMQHQICPLKLLLVP